MSDLTPGRPDQAIAAVLAGESTHTRNLVSVDLSRGFSTNRVTVSFDDCDRPPMMGDLVTAVDLASHQEAPAEVVGINEEHRTVALIVDWDRIREVAR